MTQRIETLCHDPNKNQAKNQENIFFANTSSKIKDWKETEPKNIQCCSQKNVVHHLNDIGNGDYLSHNNMNGPQPHTTILPSKRSNIIWEIVSNKILMYFPSIRGYQLKHEKSTYLSSSLWLRINIRIITTIIKQPLVHKIHDFSP